VSVPSLETTLRSLAALDDLRHLSLAPVGGAYQASYAPAAGNRGTATNADPVAAIVAAIADARRVKP
jgi:hypothetical protein